MYCIAITKEGKTDFYKGSGGRPSRYPTLADALVSAQYLGLTRQAEELHFVKGGADLGAISKTAAAASGGGGDQMQALEQNGGSNWRAPLEKMSKEQLAACAKERGIAVSADASKKEILAIILEAEKQGDESAAASGGGGDPQRQASSEGGDGSGS